MDKNLFKVGDYIRYRGYDGRDRIMRVCKIGQYSLFCACDTPQFGMWVQFENCKVLSKEEVFLHKLVN